MSSFSLFEKEKEKEKEKEDNINNFILKYKKVRVDQILLTQPNPIISFKLTNLVEFYTITITKLIGESHLSRALYE
jgi:hypothetical protein